MLFGASCARWAVLASTVAGLVAAENVTIYKVGYPEWTVCGQESNVEKSNLNPHYFFPVHFGGFKEGSCSDAGYSVFQKKEVIEMNPVPWVHHNLTFDVYTKPTVPLVLDLQVADPSRKNRVVNAKLCVSSDGATNARGAIQGKPLYIFGHGFDCNPDDYMYFCSVASVASVYHSSDTFTDWDTWNLAQDAVFLSRELPRRAREDPTSPLYGKWSGSVVLGGHSMGGGTTVLAAASQPSADGMAVFAPGLYTLPYAKPYLPNVTMPVLIVSGSDDCGPNQLPKEAQPTYDGVSSVAKVLVVLKGANHCQWADPIPSEVGVCKIPGLRECSKIDSATQHDHGARLLGSFLGGLQGGGEGWASFEEALAAGEAAGTWTYVSSRTSPPGKALRNDCPCRASAGELVV